jgi:hypothetical protein
MDLQSPFVSSKSSSQLSVPLLFSGMDKSCICLGFACLDPANLYQQDLDALALSIGDLTLDYDDDPSDPETRAWYYTTQLDFECESAFHFAVHFSISLFPPLGAVQCLQRYVLTGSDFDIHLVESSDDEGENDDDEEGDGILDNDDVEFDHGYSVSNGAEGESDAEELDRSSVEVSVDKDDDEDDLTLRDAKPEATTGSWSRDMPFCVFGRSL